MKSRVVKVLGCFFLPHLPGTVGAQSSVDAAPRQELEQ